MGRLAKVFEVCNDSGLARGLSALQPDYGSALVLAAIATGFVHISWSTLAAWGLGFDSGSWGCWVLLGLEHTRARVTGF